MIEAKLADHIFTATGRELPPEVTEKGKLHLIDTIAAMVSGSTLAPGQAALSFAAGRGLAGPSGIPASAQRVRPAEAALAGGMQAHANETDDSHAPSLTHPGCAVVPAALAAAQARGATGRDLLRAVVAGYDVSTRISMALGGNRFTDHYHLSPHSWAGTFGATAAASALWGLSLDQVRVALSYAAQTASGSRAWLRDPDHVQKSFIFGGNPAKKGIEAAEYAEAGLTGVADPISGTPGLLAAFRDTSDPALATEELGERFEVMRTSIKKWCVGSPLQMPLDCLDTFRREHGIREPNVARIRVTLPAARARVVMSDMADVNLPRALAMYLVDGGLGFAALHDHGRFRDPEVLRVAEKVEVAVREGAARGAQAHVTLWTTDGREFFSAPEHVRGQPGNPMSVEEVAEKARDLFSLALGTGAAERLLDALMDIEGLADCGVLSDLWQPE